MLQFDIVTAFFQHLLSFQNKCVINNITIATADDITTLSDDVNIHPVDLSGTINTLSNDLNWLEKCSYFRPKFIQFVVSHFGNSPMATVRVHRNQAAGAYRPVVRSFFLLTNFQTLYNFVTIFFKDFEACKVETWFLFDKLANSVTLNFLKLIIVHKCLSPGLMSRPL